MKDICSYFESNKLKKQPILSIVMINDSRIKRFKKTLKIKQRLILTFFVISELAFGQIKGVVVDQQNETPIEYATIVLKNGDEVINGTISKGNGSFSMKNPSPGFYQLEISFLGFKTQLIESVEIIKKVGVDVGIVSLEPSQDLLDEVVLSTNQSALRNKIDRKVYSANKFESAKGGTAVDLIRNIPSININGLGEISVRGTSGFVILLNNKPVQSDVQSLLNQLPANSIKNIEVITSPSAKYDAEGKAGIINILTSKAAVNGDYLQINTLLGAPSIEDYDNAKAAQRHGADITFNRVREKWNLSSGLSFQRNDLLGRREGDVFTIIKDKRTSFPSDGERSFDEVNYSGRFTVDYTPTDNDRFSIGFFAGKRSKDRTADIIYYNNRATENGVFLYENQYFNENLRIRKSDFALGSIDYDHTFINKAKLSTSLLYEYTLLGGPTTNRNLAYPNTTTLLQDEYNTNDNPLNGLRFNLDYQFKPFSFGGLEIGYQYRNLDHKGDFVYERKNNATGLFELVTDFSSEVNLKRAIHAAYAQFDAVYEKWNFGAGLRVEQMERDLSSKDKSGIIDQDYKYDFTKLFPSANIVYNINENSNLKLAYSKRIERTTTFKMNPFPEREHSETLEQGDPNLRPELVDQIELGVSNKNTRGDALFSTLYYRKVDQLINRVNTVYNDTILNRIYSNVGKGRTFGAEFGSEFSVGEKWKNLASVNVFNYEIKGSFDNKPIDYKSLIYSINLNSTYRFSKNTSLQFTFNYLSDRVTAQGEDSRFYSPNLTFTKRFWEDQLTASLQWKNIDLGLMDTNEQRITTSRPNEFYTTTNYVYEVDVILISLSYNFNNRKNTSKFIQSEFGKREF